MFQTISQRLYILASTRLPLYKELGNSKLGISNTGNYCWRHPCLYPCERPIYPCMAMHGQNSRTLPLRQIFICGPILLSLGHVTRVDTRGHPWKFGKNPPRRTKVSNFRSSPLWAYGKLATGERHVDSLVSRGVVKDFIKKTPVSRGVAKILYRRKISLCWATLPKHVSDNFPTFVYSCQHQYLVVVASILNENLLHF